MARRGMSKSRATFYTGLVIIIVTFGITIYAQWNEISDAFGWNEAEYVTYAEGDPVVHFVNSRDRPASAQNAARFIPFEFDYPASWDDWPGREGTTVFLTGPKYRGADTRMLMIAPVMLTRPGAQGEQRRESIREVMDQIATSFGGSSQDFQLLSSGPQMLGDRETTGFRFAYLERPDPGEGGDPMRLFGRGDIVFPAEGDLGIYVIALGTEAAPEFFTSADIDDDPGFTLIFDTLRIGEAELAHGKAAE